MCLCGLKLQAYKAKLSNAWKHIWCRRQLGKGLGGRCYKKNDWKNISRLRRFRTRTLIMSQLFSDQIKPHPDTMSLCNYYFNHMTFFAPKCNTSPLLTCINMTLTWCSCLYNSDFFFVYMEAESHSGAVGWENASEGPNTLAVNWIDWWVWVTGSVSVCERKQGLQPCFILDWGH